MRLLKNLIFGMLVVMVSNTVAAQGFGIRGGVNISNVNGGNINTENLTGYYLGVYKEMTLVKDLLFVQPEVQYSSQGFKTSISEIKIDYITVPILAKVYLVKLFSFETGPQFGFKISDKVDGPANPDFESFDPTWAFGMSINLPFHLSLNARYVTSFNEVITDSDAKNEVVQVGAAFRF